jgi:site-specific DNA-methyltransferase (adenine-specific)
MRDSIAWLYGSGFPKSHDVSKAIDKAAGAEREKVRVNSSEVRNPKATGGGRDGTEGATRPWIERALELGYHEKDSDVPATPEALKWQGWGTALKPAFEPIVVARKPLIGTVAANVLKWGTGGLNIDASRIGTEQVTINTFDNGAKPFGGAVGEPFTSRHSVGRWPANIILDPYTAELLDEQSDASRFFYIAKASKRDRNEGLEELEEVRHSDRQSDDKVGGDNPRNRTNQAKQNFHPTVKPTALMEYLIKLVTPEGGTVLDPFTGSGSTGKAALLNGFNFIGIELTEEYLPIIEGRLKWAINQTKIDKGESLF